MKNFNRNYELISGNTNQIFKHKVRAMEQASSVEDGKGEIYMNFIKHYTSIFRPKGSEELLKIGPSIVEKMWGNGSGAIYIVGEEAFVTNTLHVKKVGYDGIPLLGEGSISPIGSKTKKFTLTRKNTVFFRANLYKGPLFMGLDKFIDDIAEYFELLPIDIGNSIASVNFFTNDAKDIEKLKEVFTMNDRKNAFKVYSGANNISKEVIQSKSVNKEIMEVIDYTFNTMYRLRGRKLNVNEKMSEVKEAEVKTNSEQFDTITEDYRLYLQEMINQGNDITNQNVTLEHITEYASQLQPKEYEGGNNNGIQNTNVETVNE